MKEEKFFLNISKLERYFNLKLSPEKYQTYLKRLRYIPDAAFDKIVDCIYDNEKYFPKISDFKKYLKTANAPKEEENSEIKVNPDCHHCNDTGFVIVKYPKDQKLKDFRFATRCFCEQGLTKSKSVNHVNTSLARGAVEI